MTDLFDQLLVLGQGRLFEQGTHMPLLDRRGLSANLSSAAVASPTLRSRCRLTVPEMPLLGRGRCEPSCLISISLFYMRRS